MVSGLTGLQPVSWDVIGTTYFLLARSQVAPRSTTPAASIIFPPALTSAQSLPLDDFLSPLMN